MARGQLPRTCFQPQDSLRFSPPARRAVGDRIFRAPHGACNKRHTARCSLVGVPRLPPRVSATALIRTEPLARGSSESAHGASFTDDNLVKALSRGLRSIDPATRAGCSSLKDRSGRKRSPDAQPSFFGPWCNGSTAGFDPVSPSSNLGGPVFGM